MNDFTLRNIAYDLRAEYEDFQESVNDEMDVLLGEIYREKLRHVFQILKNNGVDIDKVRRVQ